MADFLRSIAIACAPTIVGIALNEALEIRRARAAAEPPAESFQEYVRWRRG